MVFRSVSHFPFAVTGRYDGSRMESGLQEMARGDLEDKVGI